MDEQEHYDNLADMVEYMDEYIHSATEEMEDMSLKEKRQQRKDSFIAFLQDEKNEPLRLWQALLVWAKVEYKDEIVPIGDKPEIHAIFAGFDQDACEDCFYWE